MAILELTQLTALDLSGLGEEFDWFYDEHNMQQQMQQNMQQKMQQNLQQLQVLILEDSMLIDSDLGRLGQVIRNLPRLQVLDISSCRYMKATTATAIVTTCSLHPAMTGLHIHGARRHASWSPDVIGKKWDAIMEKGRGCKFIYTRPRIALEDNHNNADLVR